MGILFAIIHTLGVLALQAGLVDLLQWVHLATVQVTVHPFSLVPFVVGIITAFVSGYIVGMIYVALYNRIR